MATPDSQLSLPPGFSDGALFQAWEADSLKLYLWLRAHVRRSPPLSEDPGLERRGYLEVDTTGAAIELAIGVSKNTVTKLVRDLDERRVATSRADRAGYHFRLGEWFARRAAGPNLELVGEAFYLDAILPGQPAAQ